MNKNIIANYNDASITYDTKIVICDNGYIELKKYDKSFTKIKQGYEEIKKEYLPITSKTIDEIENKKSKKFDEILTRNLTRTRDNIIQYACENEKLFHSFITLTLSDNKEHKLSTDIDINDISQANKLFNIWRTQIKRKFPHFSYICVPEYQKRGAIHYHLITSLKCGVDIPKLDTKYTFNEEKKKYFELEYYNIPYWNYGFSTAYDLNKTDDNFNVALYITKYLYKDIDNRLYGHQKLMKSDNLKKPKKIYCNSALYESCISYLKEKDYDINQFAFKPIEKYQVAFDKSDLIVLQDDYNLIKDNLANEYSER